MNNVNDHLMICQRWSGQNVKENASKTVSASIRSNSIWRRFWRNISLPTIQLATFGVQHRKPNTHILKIPPRTDIVCRNSSIRVTMRLNFLSTFCFIPYSFLNHCLPSHTAHLNGTQMVHSKRHTNRTGICHLPAKLFIEFFNACLHKQADPFQQNS